MQRPLLEQIRLLIQNSLKIRSRKILHKSVLTYYYEKTFTSQYPVYFSPTALWAKYTYTAPYTYIPMWWVITQIIYQGTCSNGLTIHLSLLLLVSLSLQLLRTPSHSWCNQRSVLPKFQCDEMICYTTKDHSSLQDQTACENTFHAFQYLSETQSCLWHLSSVLVCSCHNIPYKLHIDTIHYRWLPSHMHNIYHLL